MPPHARKNSKVGPCAEDTATHVVQSSMHFAKVTAKGGVRAAKLDHCVLFLIRNSPEYG